MILKYAYSSLPSQNLLLCQCFVSVIEKYKQTELFKCHWLSVVFEGNILNTKMNYQELKQMSKTFIWELRRVLWCQS